MIFTGRPRWTTCVSRFFLTACFLLLFSSTAQGAPTVILDGEELTFDSSPVVEKGRILVPLRTIFEALGAELIWDDAAQTVTASHAGSVAIVQIGNTIAFANNKPIFLEAPASLHDGRTLVPLRFVSEAMGAQVQWNQQDQIITITRNKGAGGLDSEAGISQTAGPAVAYIEAYDFKGEPIGSGSCFIVADGDKVVTNYHVIDRATRCMVKLTDGRSFTVDRLVNYSVTKDVAVLAIKGDNLPVIRLGDSDQVINGQKVVAIGSPAGLENTIANGLISNSRREIFGQRFIQTSVPLSPGSSGGVLLNYKGEAIGVTSRGIRDAQNLNFAVPINDIKPYIFGDNLNLPLKKLAMEESKKVRIFYATMCLGVDEDELLPLQPGRSFSPDVERIYCFIEFAKPVDDTIIGRWYYIDDGERTLVDTMTDELTGDDVCWIWLDNPGKPFTAGEWEFEFTVGNGARQSLSFQVRQTEQAGQPPNKPAENEPNNEWELADYLPLNQNLPGSFDQTGDVDYYILNILRSGKLWIGGETGQPEQVDLQLRLYNSDQQPLAVNTVLSQGIRTIEHPVKPGYYYLVAANKISPWSSGPYKLLASLLK